MNISRKSFLRGVASAVAAAPALGFPAVVKLRKPNEMLSHACIGTGNMARADLHALKSHRDIHITALCDVDANFLEQAKKECPDARVYRDAFEMFAAEGDKIDSVNVSTPDHTHAQFVIEALKRGLNVYSQKPLCTKLKDSREIIRLAAEKKAVTQLGTQIAAWDCDRRTAGAIKSESSISRMPPMPLVSFQVEESFTPTQRLNFDSMRSPVVPKIAAASPKSAALPGAKCVAGINASETRVENTMDPTSPSQLLPGEIVGQSL